jgi:hypothetical protein
VEVALTIDVPGTRVRGRLVSCPPFVAPDECEHGRRSSLEIDPPTFDGEAGVHTFDVHAPLDDFPCTLDEPTYLLAIVDLEDASSGEQLGTFASPLTRTIIETRHEPRVVLEPPVLTFSALAGQAAPAQKLFRNVYCASPQPVFRPFTAVADVPWLTVTDTPYPLDDAVLVAVDTASLDPAASPYQTTLHVMAEGVSSTPVDLPVVVNVVDLTARWVTPPPPTVAAGSDVPLALEVTGDVAHVEGSLQVCEEWGSDGCLLYTLELDAADGRFSGPPGTFSFVAHRPYDCLPDTEVEIRPYVMVTDQAGNTLGPFALPLARFTAAASSEEEIEVGPASVLQGLTVDLPDGALMIPQVVALRSSCHTSSAVHARWTGMTSAPWVSLSRDEGGLPTHQYVMPAEVAIDIDPTQLPAGEGPHTAEVTFSAPGTRNGAVHVPVTVRRHPDVRVRWVDPVPSSTPIPLHTGDPLAFRLDVTGAATSVVGAVDVCYEPPPSLLGCPPGGSVGFDHDGVFEGPPGAFLLEGVVPPTCYDYGDRILRTVLTISPSASETWSPVQAPSHYLDRIRGGDPLTVAPQTLTLRGLLGQRPLVGTLRVKVPPVGCFGNLPWRVQTSAPWLTATPEHGTINSSGSPPGRLVWMIVDPTMLDPAASPHHAEAVFEFPTGETPSITVPVQVELIASEGWPLAP